MTTKKPTEDVRAIIAKLYTGPQLQNACAGRKPMRLSGETCKEPPSKGLSGDGRRRKCYAMAVLAAENTKANMIKLKLRHPGLTPQSLRGHAVALAAQPKEVPRLSPLTTKPNTPKTNIREAAIADPSIAIQLRKPRPIGSSVKEAHIANLSLSKGKPTTLTNLLCGHVVQADGFSARTLRAKRGSAMVVVLLQQTVCGRSSNQSLVKYGTDLN